MNDRVIKTERECWKKVLILLLYFTSYRLVFVDETAFYTHMAPRYGYARGSRRLRAPVRKRSPRYTLIGAMGLCGMLAASLLNRAMTEQDWVSWVKEHLLPSLPARSVVIWDNLNIHYNKEAIKALEDAGHVVLHQSRYSPDLNPIEMAWNKMKTLVRQAQPKGAALMRQAVDAAWNAITKDDILQFFGRVFKHIYSPGFQGSL